MLYRYARHARFVDGADEVHRETVARQILKAYDAPEDGIPTEHVPTRREAARQKFAALARHRRWSTAEMQVQLVRWQAEPELREIEVPEPGPGDVLVKVLGRGALPLRPPRHGVARGHAAVDAAVHPRARERRASSQRSAPA